MKAERTKQPTSPDVARSSHAADADIREFGGIATERTGESASPPPPTELSQAPRGAPATPELLRHLTSPRARQGVLRHLQHFHGNSHTASVIARSRTAGPMATVADSASTNEELERDASPLAVAVEPQFGSPPDPLENGESGAPRASDAPMNEASTAAAPAPAPVIQRNVFGDIGDFVSDLGSEALDLVSSGVDAVLGALKTAYEAIVAQITKVWETVKDGVDKAVNLAIKEATAFIGGISSLFAAVGAALSGLDGDMLGKTWSAITGAASAALAFVRSLVTRVTSTIDGLWKGLKGLADDLIGGLRSKAEGLIGKLPGPLQGTARSLWGKIEGLMTSAWRKIESAWTSLRTTVLDKVMKIVKKVAEVAEGLKDSVVTTIVETLKKAKAFFDLMRRMMANPEAFLMPMVQEITNRLQPLPEKAKEDAKTEIQKSAGGAGAGPGVSEDAPGAPAGTAALQPSRAPSLQRLGARVVQRSRTGVVQRDGEAGSPGRTTLGIGAIIGGCWDFVTDKLKALWDKLGATIKEMVLSLVWPPATWEGLKKDWDHMTKELSARSSRWQGIRTDSWDGFWEDLRRWISNLLDYPLIVWRAVNAMLGRISVYLGLAIILGGAVLGAIAGGTGGAVFGSIIPVAGTGAGTVGGVAAGTWAGIQAGWAAAETVGLVLLASFLVAEQLSIGKAVADLSMVPQSKEEQDEDFNQVADSSIAMATAALLIAIAFIGVAIAKKVWAFVRSIPGRFRAKPVEVDPTAPKTGEVPKAKPGSPDALVVCRVCDVVPGVPADLMAKRKLLTPDARARLDQTAAAIFPDPLNPTPKQFDGLRSFMNAMEKKGAGDLEAGLQKLIAEDAARKAPAPAPPAKPPFGTQVHELPRLRAEVDALIKEITDFAAANPDKATIKRAADSLKSSTDGILGKMETGQMESSPYGVQRTQDFLKGAKGELESAKTAPSNTKFSEIVDGREIDQIRPDGSYHQVKKWDPFPLSSDANSLYVAVEKQLRGTLKAAVDNPIGGKPRPVTMEFQNGVKKDVAAALRAIDHNGHRATIVGTEVP